VIPPRLVLGNLKDAVEERRGLLELFGHLREVAVVLLSIEVLEPIQNERQVTSCSSARFSASDAAIVRRPFAEE
jgi:hypothetical protein